MDRKRRAARGVHLATSLRRLALMAALAGLSGCGAGTGIMYSDPLAPEMNASAETDVSREEAASGFARRLLKNGQFDSKRDLLSPEDSIKPFFASIVCAPKAVLMQRFGRALQLAHFKMDFDSDNAASTATYIREQPLATYCDARQKDGPRCNDKPLGRPPVGSDLVRDVVSFRIHKQTQLVKCDITVFRAAARWFVGDEDARPARGPLGAHRDDLLWELEKLFGSVQLEGGPGS